MQHGVVSGLSLTAPESTMQATHQVDFFQSHPDLNLQNQELERIKAQARLEQAEKAMQTIFDKALNKAGDDALKQQELKLELQKVMHQMQTGSARNVELTMMLQSGQMKIDNLVKQIEKLTLDMVKQQDRHKQEIERIKTQSTWTQRIKQTLVGKFKGMQLDADKDTIVEEHSEDPWAATAIEATTLNVSTTSKLNALRRLQTEIENAAYVPTGGTIPTDRAPQNRPKIVL